MYGGAHPVPGTAAAVTATSRGFTWFRNSECRSPCSPSSSAATSSSGGGTPRLAISGQADAFILPRWRLCARRPLRPRHVAAARAGRAGVAVLIVGRVLHPADLALGAVLALPRLRRGAGGPDGSAVAAHTDHGRTGDRADLHRVAHGFVLLAAGLTVLGVVVPARSSCATRRGGSPGSRSTPRSPASSVCRHGHHVRLPHVRATGRARDGRRGCTGRSLSLSAPAWWPPGLARPCSPGSSARRLPVAYQRGRRGRGARGAHC